MFEWQRIHTYRALFSDFSLLDRHLNKIRWIFVELHNKGYYLAHGLVGPVSEGAQDVRYTICCYRLVSRALGERIECTLVVSTDLGVLVLCHLRDSWHPNEQSKNMVIAIPTFAILISTNLPLSRTGQKLFKSEMALNDQRRFTSAPQVDHILLMYTLWLYNFAEFKPFTDIFPKHGIRFLRLFFEPLSRGLLSHEFNEPTFLHRMIIKFAVRELFGHWWNYHLWLL